MAFAGMCPYLKNTKSLDRTVCECAQFTFPDKEVRRDVLYACCGHPEAWERCPFKAAMDSYYYERKYKTQKAVNKFKYPKRYVNISCSGVED